MLFRTAAFARFGSLSKPFLFTEFGCNTGAFKTKCPDYKDGRSWVQAGIWMNYRGVDHAGLSSTKLPGFLLLVFGFFRLDKWWAKWVNFSAVPLPLNFQWRTMSTALWLHLVFWADRTAFRCSNPFIIKRSTCTFSISRSHLTIVLSTYIARWR